MELFYPVRRGKLFCQPTLNHAGDWSTALGILGTSAVICGLWENLNSAPRLGWARIEKEHRLVWEVCWAPLFSWQGILACLHGIVRIFLETVVGVCTQRCMCVHLCIFLTFKCLCIDNSSFLCSPPQPSRRFFPPPMPLSKPGENSFLILYITGMLLQREVVVYSWGIQDTEKWKWSEWYRGHWMSLLAVWPRYVLFLFLLNLLCRNCCLVH